MSVQVEQLFCGTVTGPPAYFFRDAARGRIPLASVLGLGVPKGAYLEVPVGAFLVRHPDGGPFLIDAGFHPDAVDDPAGEFGRFLGRVFAGLETSQDLSLLAQLETRGVDPDEISVVVMTHLHPDHASGLRMFPRARVICSSAEWRSATGRLATVNGYVGHHLPQPARVQQVDFRSEGRPDGAFTAVVDLFGDGSVKLVSTPGHTVGHLSVLLETDSDPTLVVGDAVYTLEALDGPRPPFRNANEDAWHESVAQLNEFRRQAPGARLIPTHDPDAWVESVVVGEGHAC